MIFKYIIGLIIGYIVSIILSIIATVLFFGIPECNNRLKNETDKINLQALKLLRKKYFISLLIWLPIIILITTGCYFLLKKALIGYLIGVFINIFTIIKHSTKNENNLLDFENSFKSNKSFIMDKEVSN